MIGSKNQRADRAARHRQPEHDAADRGDQEADQGAIEREAGVDEQIARDRIVIDALQHGA